MVGTGNCLSERPDVVFDDLMLERICTETESDVKWVEPEKDANSSESLVVTIGGDLKLR